MLRFGRDTFTGFSELAFQRGEEAEPFFAQVGAVRETSQLPIVTDGKSTGDLAALSLAASAIRGRDVESLPLFAQHRSCREHQQIHLINRMRADIATARIAFFGFAPRFGEF